MRKLVKIAAAAVMAVASVASANAAEATFDPNSSTQFYDINGNGILSLWGVTAANGNALKANPDYNYPTELSIASWVAMLLKAQQMNKVVVVGYDPATYEIWYIARPR
jgi:hypothetical protein